MSDTSPISEVVVRSPTQVAKGATVTVQAPEHAQSSTRNVAETDVSAEALKSAVQQVESIVNSVADTSLSFSVDEELSRMSEPTRVDNVTTYGHWSTLAGYFFAFGIIWLMFYLADGFS